MNTPENIIFPKGEKAPADYFTGTTWVKMLVQPDDIFNTSIRIGYYQEKGKRVQILRTGDVVRIPPGLEPHGASPDSEFTHIAINANTQKGIVVWLQRVTDEEYTSFK